MKRPWPGVIRCGTGQSRSERFKITDKILSDSLVSAMAQTWSQKREGGGLEVKRDEKCERAVDKYDESTVWDSKQASSGPLRKLSFECSAEVRRGYEYSILRPLLAN